MFYKAAPTVWPLLPEERNKDLLHMSPTDRLWAHRQRGKKCPSDTSTATQPHHFYIFLQPLAAELVGEDSACLSAW